MIPYGLTVDVPTPSSQVMDTPPLVDVVVASTVGVLQVMELVVGLVVTEISGISVDTVYVCLQPVERLVAVKVKTPIAVDVPGLPTGLGVGSVGASQPSATPGCEDAIREMVVVLQLTLNVAVGCTVFPVTVTLTDVEH